MNKLLQKFQDLANDANLSKGTLRSKEMFMKLARNEGEIKNISAVTQKLQPVGKMKTGQLITYEYGAKYAEKLPYWDRYPLVYVTQVNKDGWVGINMHYLHPRIRARMFYDMQKSNTSIIEHDSSIFGMKRYLASYVQSHPKIFPQDLWEIAVQLPYENFAKESKNFVWKDVAKKKK